MEEGNIGKDGVSKGAVGKGGVRKGDMGGRRSSWSLLVILVLFVVVTASGWCWQRSARNSGEKDRIAEILDLQAGFVVADVGGGNGEWTLDLAARVGEQGHVFSTEVDQRQLRRIRDAVEDAGLSHVTVIEGAESESGLDEGCCDAILLRHVYHHFTDRNGMTRSLFEALRPGGLIAIIEFPQMSRGDEHGMGVEDLMDDVTAAGFELVREVEGWPGRDYCVLFRRPDSGR
jgi:SAM-dependent methyltransferase